MIRKYNVIECDDSKFYKSVPYISKKDFSNIEDYNIVGTTKLKKYKSSSERKELDLIYYDDNQYEVKNKILGFRKGYIYVENNNYVELKKQYPFLFLLFLLLLLLTLFFVFKPDKKVIDDPVIPPHQEEIVIPQDEEIIPSDKDEVIKPPSNNKIKPNKKPQEQLSSDYEILFDANGGYGNMKSIICKINASCNLKKNEFKKEGYNFKGWSVNKDAKELYSDESKIDSLSSKPGDKVVLYAIWDINSYSIKFLDYDDSVLKEEFLDYEEKIIPPSDPVRNGYTFSGWDSEIKVIKEETIIKAQYKINDYKISYILNGGKLNDVPPKYNVETDTFTLPYPTKTGYTFLGWTTSEEVEPIKDYTIEKGSTGNIELIANYVANSYNLIFNSNDDNDSLITRKVEYNTKYGELPEPTKTGYTFVGWKNEEGEFVTKETIYNIPNDINLYGEWKIVDYDIVYILNGGKLNDVPPKYNVETDTFTLPYPIKTGYIFLGWTTLEEVEPIKDYTIEKGSTGNKTLIANYQPISYFINYNSSGGVGTMNQDEFIYNQSKKLSKNIYTKEGYIFKGWSTSSNGEVVYDDESEIYNLSSKSDKVITLYAKWEIIKLNVKYYDLFGALLKNETVDYGNKSIAPEEPSIEGYTFVKWNPEPDIIKTDTIYEAQYSINEYTIKYDLNMGSESDKNSINYNVESNTFTLPQPTRIGYTFLGWTGSNGLKPQVNLTINKGTIGNKSYKANWVANIYKVTLNANGGTADISSILVSYNSLYGELPTPSRIGYTFEGWYYGDQLVNESTLQDRNFDHELKAKWKVITYNITYNLNGGSATLKTTYNIETDTFTLPEPTKTGYTFLGWTGSNGTTPSKSVSIPKGSIGDKSYTANWQVITYNITYNLNGGSATLKTTYNIETDTFTLPEPTKTGYTFLGWTGSNGTTPSKSVSIPKGSIGDKSYTANWQVINYDITYNLNGGSATPLQTSYNVESNTFTLPQPTRTGYIFTGWTGTSLSSATKSVSISKGSTGNRNYTANWTANYYTVNYYQNGSLWATRSVQYGTAIPNLTPGGYDDYHKFGGWSGWSDTMPPNDITLTAITSEAYCMLQTGTASKANAEGLKAIFDDVGYNSSLYQNDLGWGAITDYSLTRRQVDGLRETFANRVPWANATPYLNWLLIQCDNGHGESWKRYSNGNTWTTLESW